MPLPSRLAVAGWLAFTLLCALPAFATASAPGCTGQLSRHITGFPAPARGQARETCPPPRPAWRAVAAQFNGSGIHRFSLPQCRIDNGRAFARLLSALHGTMPEYAIAVVPGSSESAGHHTAWPGRDGQIVEAEFRARLRHAFLLLREGQVHSIVISGGPIDQKKTSYDEGVAGYLQMMREFGPLWNAREKGPLEERLIVDPWAFHSEINVRNGDKITALLGLERNLYVTTVGGAVSDLVTQGYLFEHPHVWTSALNLRIGTLDYAALHSCGYAAKTFGAWATLPSGGSDLLGTATSVSGAPPLISCDRSRFAQYCVHGKYRTGVFLHWGLRHQELLADQLWDCGARQPRRKDCWAPDFGSIGAACAGTGVSATSWGSGSFYNRQGAAGATAQKKSARRGNRK